MMLNVYFCNNFFFIPDSLSVATVTVPHNGNTTNDLKRRGRNKPPTQTLV